MLIILSFVTGFHLFLNSLKNSHAEMVWGSHSILKDLLAAGGLADRRGLSCTRQWVGPEASGTRKGTGLTGENLDMLTHP